MMKLALDIKIDNGDPSLIGVDQLAGAVRRLGRGGEVFTVREVCGKSQSRRFGIARDFLVDLVAQGIAEDLGYKGLATPGNRAFKLTGAALQFAGGTLAAPAPSQAQRVQQQIWNVLRGPHGRAAVSVADMVMTASTAETPVSASAAGRYMNALADAGYLTIEPRQRPKTYRLVQRHKSGPLAPVLLQARLLFDPNRHALMTSKVMAEEVAA